MTATIRLETEGRRIWILGNTYPIRARLREIGCKFDGQRRAWWIGVTKRKEVEALVGVAEGEATVTADAEAAAREEEDRLARDRDNVLGRAKYKGRTYYVVWHGDTRRGEAYRLMFRDGSKTFWADASDVEVIRWYEGAMTLSDLQAYAQRMQSARSAGVSEHVANEEARAEAAIRRNRCRGCGGPIVHAAHHQAMGGYCGHCAFDEFD